MVKFVFVVYKSKRSKYAVEKVTIWQHFLISDKHRAYPLLIFVFWPSQLKSYIKTGLVFLIHLLRVWDLLCRKENTISSCLTWQIISFILSLNEYVCVYAWTKLGSGPAIELQKIAILAKKKKNEDEAHFDFGGYFRGIFLQKKLTRRILATFGGYVNQQNCRIWGTENLHAYIEKPTHPKRVTV